ncbi:hypothetical protein G8759_30285 [Spirosoma aureum]|uniref:Transposase n=1 Tax=Spirosoma aureum TaxID=2692134 RepID=A0A6G9AWF4_9BACT|nr:hypothetical protein [Spirosoma aureum]QIP16625.1 hypothetical protein G8759_30285 [Spirosoma aureum]
MGKFVECYNYNLLPSTTTFAAAMLRTQPYISKAIPKGRSGNNYCPTFTDQELMTTYLFGLLKERFTLRQTYDSITDHWGEGSPVAILSSCHPSA